MDSSQGRTRSNTRCSPPTIKVSAALIAPGVEPVQGAPRKSMPASASSWWIRLLADGPIVLASTTTLPFLAPCLIPLTPPLPRITDSDIAVLPTHTKTHSEFCATSAGLLHAWPPLASVANRSDFSDVFDQR